MTGKVLISQEQIQAKADEIGKQITEDYSKLDEPLLLVGILRGSVPWMADLMKKVFHINHIPSFVTPSLEEYAADPSLRIPIWENFLFIRDFLSSGKDTL